jgi:hypothetical protein
MARCGQFALVAAAFAAPVSAQRVVTIAMVDSMPETNIAVVFYRPGQTPAGVIVVNRNAGARELAAGLAIYRQMANLNREMRAVVRSTRRLNNAIRGEERARLEAAIGLLKESQHKPLSYGGGVSTRQIRYMDRISSRE